VPLNGRPRLFPAQLGRVKAFHVVFSITIAAFLPVHITLASY
jgi:hypothetical protein